MALLVILLAAPPRADSAAATVANPGLVAAAPGAAPEPVPLAWLLSPDGLAISRQGDTLPTPWPKADSVVAVVPALAVAWHRPLAPRAPANRLRAALGGVLEEQMLLEDDSAHLALAPRVVAGEPVWVAVLHKPWLQAQLTALAASGVVVDRLVPAVAPLLAPATAGDKAAAALPVGHFFTTQDQASPGGADATWLALQDEDSAVCLPLAGGLARQAQARWSARGARWSATPAATAAAEHWLGQPVAVRSGPEQALAAARSPWNLLQFDLAPQARSSLALGKLWQRLMGPAFGLTRWGLATLLLVQLVGLNVMAWQQQRAIDGKRVAMDMLLRSSHPQVRAVLDAPLQMRRETAALRAAAGVPGDEDFEPMLAAAAAAWPDGQPPAAQLRYEPGRLSLPSGGWSPAQIDQLRLRLLAAGWALSNSDGRLVMQRAAPASI